MKHTFHPVIWLAAAMLTACATSPSPADLSAYRSVSIHVNASETLDAQDQRRLESILTAALGKATPFGVVESNGQDYKPGLLIEIDTVGLRRVSNAMRISLGRSAGSINPLQTDRLLPASGGHQP